MRPTVIVVDDNASFAVHVRRSISDALEFGEASTWDADLKSKRVWVHWHDSALRNPAGGQETEKSAAQLTEWIRKRIDEGASHLASFWAIVDVRLKGKEGWEDFRDALLDAGVSEDRIRLLSSYETRVVPRGGGSPLRVWPKTPDTLEAIGMDLGIARLKRSAGPPAHPRASLAQWGNYNVLVTGAGFEIRGHRAATGLPPTAQILNDLVSYEMPVPRFPPPSPDYDPSVREQIVFEPQPNGFPLIKQGFAYDIDTQIKSAARECRLDDYWECILRSTHKAALPSNAYQTYAHKRGPQLELSLREAFRLSIAKYDIGHMRQSLLAAQQRWCAWLTTNYTGFGDRSIALLDSPRFPWRCIRTPTDAEQLMREGPSTMPTERLFIKLHGDLAHVQSMAIASTDKEDLDLAGRLTVWGELYLMYEAAQKWLIEGFRDLPQMPQGRPLCLWHVVGHGLADMKLLRLMDRVVDATSSRLEHACNLVLKRAPLTKEEIVLRHSEWEKRPSQLEHVDFHPIDSDAEAYLDELHTLPR